METNVAYLTNDLLFSSRVTSLARMDGVSIKVVGSRSALCKALAESSPVAIFVDLEHAEGDIGELIRAMSATSNDRPKIVAYGPHVKESLLSAAQQAGADVVLSRGQFDKQVRSLLHSFVTPHEPDARQDMP